MGLSSPLQLQNLLHKQATFLEWGISDALFMDGTEVRAGPPPSYEKLKGLIKERLKKP